MTVLNGTYEGLYLPNFDQDIFLGIPYAQDTGIQNRFRIPQALNETWTGIRPAKNYSEACPDISPSDWTYGVGENCLSINIVRPAGFKNESLPVVTWIHGGSYQTGTSSLPNYNLTYLVQRSVEIGKPIIATSINYRKGGWGMLYSREIQVRMSAPEPCSILTFSTRAPVKRISHSVTCARASPGFKRTSLLLAATVRR